MWETPFSQIDVGFLCKVDRVNGNPNGKVSCHMRYLAQDTHIDPKMYMINHSLSNYEFLGSPDRGQP